MTWNEFERKNYNNDNNCSRNDALEITRFRKFLSFNNLFDCWSHKHEVQELNNRLLHFFKCTEAVNPKILPQM